MRRGAVSCLKRLSTIPSPARYCDGEATCHEETNAHARGGYSAHYAVDDHAGADEDSDDAHGP